MRHEVAGEVAPQLAVAVQRQPDRRRVDVAKVVDAGRAGDGDEAGGGQVVDGGSWTVGRKREIARGAPTAL